MAARFCATVEPTWPLPRMMIFTLSALPEKGGIINRNGRQGCNGGNVVFQTAFGILWNIV